MKKIIGLTGGIGSGKSLVAKIFGHLGCAIYNSDERARAAYLFEDVKPKVIELLGKSAYINDSTIDKSFISNTIFSDTALLQKINAIIHPAVKQDFTEFVSQQSTQLIIKETALLFEANLETSVDKIILVTAPETLRIQRVMKRDGLSEDQVLKKIKAQLPENEKIKRAHFIIHNDEQQMLLPQVLEVFDELRRLLKDDSK
jgi:dephospho-CoA kinase